LLQCMLLCVVVECSMHCGWRCSRAVQCNSAAPLCERMQLQCSRSADGSRAAAVAVLTYRPYSAHTVLTEPLAGMAR
ncbi:MAG: hypothetical protein WBG74_06660, partial [Shewanella sp.]|uniref:hypothetical protein n=1 Tax=Shewanella sp. TaxID=50422 RepID=UPI003C78A5C4